MTSLFEIGLLSKAHDRAAFSCGVDALDRYFREQIGQDARKRVATCFVALDVASGMVAGYYTLASTSILLPEVHPDIKKRLPKYSTVPAALLGRLAVDKNFRGRGLGKFLVVDAIERARRSELAAALLLTDAKDDLARAFYEHLGFRATTADGLRLVLPL